MSGPKWLNLDPTTISDISVRIFEQQNELLCETNKHDKNSCRCNLVQLHLGTRPFQCGFLNCSFQRHGFETNSLRKSHMKNHSRPWNCSIQDCEFANGGFLSRKMRDEHWAICHKEEKPLSQSYPDTLDKDEIQPLLFDLVAANKVDAVKGLLPHFRELERKIRDSLTESAASSACPEMIDMLIKAGSYDITSVDHPTIRLICNSAEGNNVMTFKHLISQIKVRGRYDFARLVVALLKSESDEMFEEWYKASTSIDRSQRDRGHAMEYDYTYPTVLNAAAKDQRLAAILLSFWERVDLGSGLDRNRLGNALVRVAGTDCSVKLAEYLLDHGAEVDFRYSYLYLTPLHHAARRTSAEAADMMKFLLFRGADPDANSGKAKLKIHEEAGAKGISKWLGKSWDELVAEAKQHLAKKED